MVNITAHDIVEQSTFKNIKIQSAARAAIQEISSEYKDSAVDLGHKATESIEALIAIGDPAASVRKHLSETGGWPAAPLKKEDIKHLLSFQADDERLSSIEDFVSKHSSELIAEGQRLHKGHQRDDDFKIGDAGKSIEYRDDNYGAPTAKASAGDNKLENNLLNVNEVSASEAIEMMLMPKKLFDSLVGDLQERHGLADQGKMKNVTIEILMARGQGREVDDEQILDSLSEARASIEAQHLGEFTKLIDTQRSQPAPKNGRAL
jgi:hypothetical protein